MFIEITIKELVFCNLESITETNILMCFSKYSIGVCKIFRNRLKELRESNNITQKELAAALDMTPAAIGLYEQGRRLPDLNILLKIADYFNVSVDYLLGRTEVTWLRSKGNISVNRISFLGGEIILNSALSQFSTKQKKALTKAIEAILEIAQIINDNKI